MRKQSILALGSSTALHNSGDKGTDISTAQGKIITPGNEEEKLPDFVAKEDLVFDQFCIAYEERLETE